MFFPSSISLLSIFITYTSALSSQSLFVPTFPVVAYPLATGNGATTYLVGCTAGSDTSTCNFAQPYTLVEGQNTVQFALTAASQAVNLGCAIEGNTYMACSATGAPSGTTGVSVTAFTTFTGEAVATHFRAIALETDTNSLLTWPPPTTSSTTQSSTSSSTSASSNSVPTTTSSFNMTSSILGLVAPQTTATARVNATTTSSKGSGQVTSAGSSAMGTAPTSLIVPTMANASGFGNAGSPGASSNLGGFLSGVVAVVVAIVVGIV